MDEMRIGFGTDRHRLETGENLIVGGIMIDSQSGTVAHSDGDVLIHALIDGMLGAMGWGDIGKFFPDDKSEWKDASSENLLKKLSERLVESKVTVINFDATVHLESINLSYYRQDMIQSLQEILPGNPQGNVKFKTGEEMGPIGRGEMISAETVCLLDINND